MHWAWKNGRPYLSPIHHLQLSTQQGNDETSYPRGLSLTGWRLYNSSKRKQTHLPTHFGLPPNSTTYYHVPQNHQQPIHAIRASTCTLSKRRGIVHGPVQNSVGHTKQTWPHQQTSNGNPPRTNRDGRPHSHQPSHRSWNLPTQILERRHLF